MSPALARRYRQVSSLAVIWAFSTNAELAADLLMRCGSTERL
jgi:hypothetical protein